MTALINGLIRHAMTFGGGFLLEDGLTTATDLEAATGAVLTLVGIGWSIYNKLKKK